MGAYAQCAERLIERGFAAVPIVPGTKQPGFFFAGMWIGLANWQRPIHMPAKKKPGRLVPGMIGTAAKPRSINLSAHCA